MQIAESKFVGYLRKKGLKLTPERRSILRHVFSFRGHFNADQLYEKVHRQNKKVSRATIYRTIPLLVESQLIRQTLSNRNKASYEHVLGLPHHDHLICLSCGRVIEFIDEELEKIQNSICKKYGFFSVEHRVGIRGYCARCRSQVKS